MTQNLPAPEEEYKPPHVETVAVTDETGREVRVTPKLYEALYKGRGYKLVDPGSYTPPPGYEPFAAQNDHVESITRPEAAALDPEQVAGGKK